MVSPAITTTVKIDAEAIRRATASAIKGFMSNRANAIASSGPDTGRLHDRLGQPLFGGTADPDAPAGLGGPRQDGVATPRPQPLMLDQTQPGSPAASLGNRDALTRDREALTREARGEGGSRYADRTGFTGAAEDGVGRFAFATSLAKMRAAAAAEQAQKDTPSAPDGLMALGLGGPSRPAAPPPSRFDIWAEGAFSYYSHDRLDGKRQGHAGLFFAGADYVVMPGLLAGIMLQIDRVEEASSVATRSASGTGWMAGPYISARLSQHVYFDARTLWGRSQNDIDPLGAYIDTFETSRALASAKLTGKWAYGALSFRPSAELIYFKEQSHAYTNAIGIGIDGQQFALGRLAIGPEAAYTMKLGDERTLEPFVGLKGVWDFAKTTQATAAGEPVGGNDARARVEAGATLRSPSGLSFRALGSYDGIGDDNFQAWSGRATVVVPF